MGFKDQTRGTLFFNILQIIEFHRPNYILLENVANIVSHDQGNTYQVIRKSLTDLGYLMPSQPLIISPVDFGYPVFL
jgi:DNA (cytosine-5)-methyltransferase 1